MCLNSQDFLSFTCDCSGLDFTGSVCEIPIPCASSPCQNGGVCSNSQDFTAFSCDCAGTGFQGAVCNIVDFCQNTDCSNNGVCENDQCTCDSGFTGVECEIEIPCASSPCLNGGVCSNSGDFLSYSCDCSLIDFAGENRMLKKLNNKRTKIMFFSIF